MENRNVPFAMVLGAIFLWSTIEVASKAIAGVPPSAIAFFRFSTGAVVLMPLWVGRMGDALFRKNLLLVLPRLLLSSIVGITLTFTLFHYSLLFISASTAATMISAVPLFVLPLSFMVTKSVPDRRVLYGIFMGMVGLLTLLSGDVVLSSGQVEGGLLVLGAAFCFSIFTVWNKNTAETIGPGVATSVSLAMGSALLYPVLLFSGPVGWGVLTTGEWLVLIYLGVAATGAGYLLYFLGLQRMETSRGSSVFFMKPVIALLLAVILLGERPHIVSLAGILLVLLSMKLLFHNHPEKTSETVLSLKAIPGP